MTPVMELLTDNTVEPIDRKRELRRAAYDARKAQPDKDAASVAAVGRLVRLPEYRRARTVLWYVDCRSELRTRHVLPSELREAKRIVVPYCTVDEGGANKLKLWQLKHMDELVVGKWKIMQPPQERLSEADRLVEPDELDVIVVPGVAFSRRGGRMGNGQGYYDRLLVRTRADCPLVGLCYECQLFDELIVAPHDVFMDLVVTELAVYRGRGRLSAGAT
jgi:5-formyltetrahydrofolate cyclo-ligase